MALERMPQRKIGVNHVVVSPADPLPRHVSRVDEFVDDPLRRPFGNTDQIGEVAQPHVLVALDAEQDVGMVGEKGPSVHVNHN